MEKELTCGCCRKSVFLPVENINNLDEAIKAAINALRK